LQTYSDFDLTVAGREKLENELFFQVKIILELPDYRF